MQPGDLVRITRASIGVPKDSIGLIVKVRDTIVDHFVIARMQVRDTIVDQHDTRPFPVWHVQILKGPLRRYLTQDLRKVR